MPEAVRSATTESHLRFSSHIRTAVGLLVFLVGPGTLLLPGCGSDGNGNPKKGVEDIRQGADTVAPTDNVVEPQDLHEEGLYVPYGPDRSYYVMELQVEMAGTVTCKEEVQAPCMSGKTCCSYLISRDITEMPGRFSFGSTHIAPAISLAMSDTLYQPTYTVVTLNFGILIGTSDKPPATNSKGDYPFTGFEPEVVVTTLNKVFSSKEEGASGTIVVESWSAEEGGIFAGNFEGTIIQKTDNPVKVSASVKGVFHFILPEAQ